MTTLLEELRARFPEQIRSVEEPVSGQIVILLNGPDATGIARHLLTAYQARLVTVFAEDRVSAEGVFYNYYLFDRPGDAGLVDAEGAHFRGPSLIPVAGRGVAGH